MSDNELSAVPIVLNNINRIEPTNKDSHNDEQQGKQKKEQNEKPQTAPFEEVNETAILKDDDTGIDLLA